MVADCQHRNKRLVIDFRYGSGDRVQIQCRECLIACAPQHSGLQAWIAWLQDRRIETAHVH